MKKLFAKVTAVVSAAAMLAVPALTANATDNKIKDYLVNNRYYHRVVWEENKGIHAHRDVLVGDVNGVGGITEADATAILQYINTTDSEKKEKIAKKMDLYAADVDGNGDIDSRDAELIRYWVSNVINHVASYQRYYNDWIWRNTNNTYRVFVNDDNSYSTVLIGDVNNNGTITDSDVSALEQGRDKGFDIFNKSSNGNSGTRARRAADINNDGVVDQKDIDYIRKVIRGEKPNFDFLY